MAQLVKLFKIEQIKFSEYPADFIPAGATQTVYTDKNSDGIDCVVRGFCKDGEYHLQSIEHIKHPL